MKSHIFLNPKSAEVLTGECKVWRTALAREARVPNPEGLKRELGGGRNVRPVPFARFSAAPDSPSWWLSLGTPSLGQSVSARTPGGAGLSARGRPRARSLRNPGCAGPGRRWGRRPPRARLPGALQFPPSGGRRGSQGPGLGGRGRGPHMPELSCCLVFAYSGSGAVGFPRAPSPRSPPLS